MDLPIARLLETYGRPLDVSMPTAIRDRSPAAAASWRIGLEAGRRHALAFLGQLAEHGRRGSDELLVRVVHRSCLHAAQWALERAAREELPDTRLVFRARAEVLARLGFDLREHLHACETAGFRVAG